MTSVDYGDGQTQQYAFDSMGNRTSNTDAGGGIGGTEAYSYNVTNMLLSRAGSFCSMIGTAAAPCAE